MPPCARAGAPQLLRMVVGAALICLAWESEETRAREDVVSLMRGSAARSGGKWRTSGAVAVSAVLGGDAVIITCTAPAGCSPEGADGNVTVHAADGHGLHGLFIENITLAAGADFLLQALARARLRPEPVVTKGKVVDAYALVCPFVGAFTRATAGRGGDWSLLVGNCQAPVPAEDSAGAYKDGSKALPARAGSLPCASAFTATAKERSRYSIGLFFGPSSRLGDSFILLDLRVLRVSPRPPRLHLVPATGPDGLIPSGELRPEAGRVGEGWAGWGPSGRPLLQCPRHMLVKDGRWGVDVVRKYDETIVKLNGSLWHPLHFYSYYAGTNQQQWDEIVLRHVGGLGYQPGDRVFEAGCAAGAFLDSLARQFGVEVAGIDFASALIRIAQRRVPGSFCAADASNLSFVPSASFDHTLAFGVLTYVNDPVHACTIARQLVRITEPGGTIFLGQINDPELAITKARPKRMEGGMGVPPFYWYKFALERGLDVRVARGEEVYSKRVIQGLRHYDLHGYFRYNVYLRKPKTLDVVQQVSFLFFNA